MLTASKLQEQLHDAQARLQDQEDEIKRLGWELELRPRNTDARIVELQDKIKGLELIEGKHPVSLPFSLILRCVVADYERHLREPTRKVREDVEKEWSVKVSKLENQLESKRIWANRLDENFRAVAAENKELTEVSRMVPGVGCFGAHRTFSGARKPRTRCFRLSNGSTLRFPTSLPTSPLRTPRWTSGVNSQL